MRLRAQLLNRPTTLSGLCQVLVVRLRGNARLLPSCSDKSFQFLLVRLRAADMNKFFDGKNISIPSGAIKRRRQRDVLVS